jgi:hypothetical protein
MRRTHILALSCLLAAPVAFAQAPQAASAFKMQLAMKMYDLSGADNVFRSIEADYGSNVMDGIGQGLGDKAGCEALKPEIQTYRTKLDGIFSGLNDASFKQEAAKVYADNYTEDEMRQIIAFEQSPAGKKLGKVQGEVNKRIVEVAVSRAKTHAEIDATTSSFVNNVKKIAATCPSAPPAAPAAPPVK